MVSRRTRSDPANLSARAERRIDEGSIVRVCTPCAEDVSISSVRHSGVTIHHSTGAQWERTKTTSIWICSDMNALTTIVIYIQTAKWAGEKKTFKRASVVNIYTFHRSCQVTRNLRSLQIHRI